MKTSPVVSLVPAPAVSESPKSSHPGKKMLTLAVSPQLHARLALLARAEGTTMNALVVETLSANLKERIKTALDSLRAEFDETEEG